MEPDMLTAAVDEFIFDPEVDAGTLSEPIFDDMVVTGGGYWLVTVSEIEANRETSEGHRNFLRSKISDEWVISLRDDPGNEVESYLDDEQRQWAILRVWGG